MIARLRDWLGDRTGAAAAELALLLPALTLLLFGIIHLCLLVYSAMQLNYAAEATARCLVTSANSASASATCVDITAAKTYFKSRYHGVTATPTFANVNEAPTCNTTGTADTDYQVSVTAPYVINAGVASKTVTLAAKACFPHT